MKAVIISHVLDSRLRASITWIALPRGAHCDRDTGQTGGDPACGCPGTQSPPGYSGVNPQIPSGSASVLASTGRTYNCNPILFIDTRRRLGNQGRPCIALPTPTVVTALVASASLTQGAAFCI